MKPGHTAPQPRLLRWVAAWAGLALVAALLRLIDAVWVAGVSELLLDGVLVGVIVTAVLAAWDWLQLGRLAPLTLGRHLPANVPVKRWTEVVLTVHHSAARQVEVELFDLYPDGMEVQYLPRRVELHPGQVTRMSYRLRPNKRGNASFGGTQVRLPSVLKFWCRTHLWGAPEQVRVYPDFAAIASYQLLATDNHTSQLGIKRTPRRGEGLEFHQLRDYRGGDTLRQIDWKATVRRHKLISREYQDERDQQIFFMLDTGRRMRTQDDQLSHFDHALNAVLLLSYVALKQGDAVGLMSFGGERRWLPPVKSTNAVNTILNNVYDLQPTTHASDYAAAAQEVLHRQRKRSLIVLVTNLAQESVDELHSVLHLLGKKHLVLIANLREEVLDQTLQKPVTHFNDALNYLGASHYLDQRQRARRQLLQRGVLNLDVVPGELAVSVVNSYWEIKQRGGL